MAKILFTSVSLLIICQFVVVVVAQVTYVNKGCVGKDNGSKAGDTIRRQVNLVLLIIDLSSKASTLKFYNDTIVDPPYNVYGLYQCREDLSLDNCNRCIQDALDEIQNVCPSYFEAIVWYQECMLRYSNRSIFSKVETSPSYEESNTSHVSNYANFSSVLESSIDSLINYTASSTPLHIAASENMVTSTEKLYCFAQCTPDLDISGCGACLRRALTQVLNCCSEITEAMVFLPSCQLRYDNISFWMGDMPLAPPINQGHTMSPALGKNNKSSSKTGIIAAIVSATSIGLVLLGLGLWLRHYKKKRQQLSTQIFLGAPQGITCMVVPDPSNIDDIKSLESLHFDFKRIKAATSNFSIQNKLGQGGFGEVYKGKLPNGEVIAVKRLSKNSYQGISEFKNEVLLVAKLQHRNLVKLLGFCLLGKEQILIYEFLPNLSLDRFLYDQSKRESLVWETRFRIIVGVARGLLYLHEDSRLKIIHRDLKSSNILLDEAMNSKIADFGLAKLFDLNQKQGDTQRIAGTYGYMAPEYAMAGQFSVKSDVYSFGVIVLEIVSGQRNSFFHQQPNEGLLHRVSVTLLLVS
ncbi:hypothetical protein RND81_06G128300 [Saponaria officinalis]|uniref:Cysteine-rich receptor-like protein kinase 10 n=1 Tax=Saponaria officinalis TaxID=3572 RepID=A0AAW1K992_SAPOF